MSTLKSALRHNQSWDTRAFLEQGFCLCWSPTELMVGWGNIKKTKTYRPDSVSVWAPHFFLDLENSWLEFEFVSLVPKKDLLDQLVGWDEKNWWQEDFEWSEPDFYRFAQNFERIQSLFASGEYEKVVPVVASAAVPAQKKRRAVSKNLKAHWLKNALRWNWPLRAYGVWAEDQGMLGVTPEVLLEVNYELDQLHTMALAGTRRADGSGNLLLDPKERKEHQIVVNSILQTLQHYQPIAEDTVEETFHYLVHLQTQISGVIPEGFNESLCLASLHPTPALGVHPKSQGQGFEILKEFSVEPRKRFGAPFGLRTAGESRYVVAIRNIEWDNEQLMVKSGCGVVAESDCQKEWEELANKRASVLRMLSAPGEIL